MSEMSGKVCIVTGSNSGIGKETALALAKMGATVVMVARNQERCEIALAEIIENTGSSSIDLMLCDLSSMDEVRQFTNAFKNKYDRLDVLINNAGAVFSKRQTTVDGFESTLAVNYLAPFLMTYELLPLLKSSAPSRVINLSSGLHKRAKIDIDDLQHEKSYPGRRVYGSVKLMVVMQTYEMARRLDGTGVAVNVVLPGFVATNLGSSSGSFASKIMFKLVRPMQISAEEGALTSLYVATSPEVEGVSGKNFAKSKEAASSDLSYDRDLQKQLWDATVDMLGLTWE
ncbi:MAG: SDR family oxidoreductase [Candidatus Thorarchaeota archaeon]